MTERVIVATGQGGLEDNVSPVFGRAATFTVVEVKGGQVAEASVIQNPHQDAPSGAGIQAAQLVAGKAPGAVLAGNFGPNVSGVLSQAGVEMVPVSGMNVREAVNAFLGGKLTSSVDPATASAGGPFAAGAGARGMGRGGGRGMGRGGRGRGQGLGTADVTWSGAAGPTPRVQPEDPQVLKGKLVQLESDLEEIKRKLAGMEGGA